MNGFVPTEKGPDLESHGGIWEFVTLRKSKWGGIPELCAMKAPWKKTEESEKESGTRA